MTMPYKNNRSREGKELKRIAIFFIGLSIFWSIISRGDVSNIPILLSIFSVTQLFIVFILLPNIYLIEKSPTKNLFVACAVMGIFLGVTYFFTLGVWFFGVLLSYLFILWGISIFLYSINYNKFLFLVNISITIISFFISIAFLPQLLSTTPLFLSSDQFFKIFFISFPFPLLIFGIEFYLTSKFMSKKKVISKSNIGVNGK